MPDICAVFVTNDERRAAPLGVKGVGESPMADVAAASANAVHRATGVCVRQTPIGTEEVLL